MSVQRLGVSASGVGKKKSSGSALTKSKRTDMLFTHKGYSGPSVLDLSHHMIRAAMLDKKPQRQSSGTKKDSGADASTAAKTTSVANDVPRPAAGGDSPTLAPPVAPPSATLLVNWTGEPAAVWEDRFKVGDLDPPACSLSLLGSFQIPWLARPSCRSPSLLQVGCGSDICMLCRRGGFRLWQPCSGDME